MSCTRRVPDLDYLTECDNRVWGCSSGENVIYACKLGDPTNWFSYRKHRPPTAMAVTVGSDGSFTGAATCMGSVLFFKENTLHKLCGSKPSDFQLSSLRCRGVAKYAAESLCVINETLYYLSPEGVMAWDGSLPVKVSGMLDPSGLAGAQRAAGGWLDGRYYLYLARDSGARLLVYDTEKGLWHQEDPGPSGQLELLSSGRQLYLWDGAVPVGGRSGPGGGRRPGGRGGRGRGEHPLCPGDRGHRPGGKRGPVPVQADPAAGRAARFHPDGVGQLRRRPLGKAGQRGCPHRQGKAVHPPDAPAA